MQVACDDIIQHKIADELKNRERMLRETYRELKNTAQDNEIFQSVLDDYTNYYTFIVDEKQRQMNAFQTILDHLEKLNSETILSEKQMNQLRIDQRVILENIGFIKKEIDDIVDTKEPSQIVY